MKPLVMAPLSLSAEIEHWPLVTPFHITGHVWEVLDVLVVTLRMGEWSGRGEAAGVYYKNDQPSRMLEQIESICPRIELGLSRESLQPMLPAGGARNALDCALWDLESRATGRAVWELAGLSAPRSLISTFTCGAETPEVMAATARRYRHARAIKLKLTGDAIDEDRIKAVREARPDVWLGVDANQGFTRKFLEHLMPTLLRTKVQLIEQPFPVGQESLLDGLGSPIPIAADETAQSLLDVPQLAGRFQAINIKLDKCGGLTAGLEMAEAARELGLTTMVGNMLGTSLAMSPAFVLGQLCEVVDLDGPTFLKNDRSIRVRYDDGLITCSDKLWGGCPQKDSSLIT
jgi:L-alanine-DL-glutamate epimerase-like enolase superfamily enzyme